MCLQTVFAAIIYKFIIQKRKTVSAYLVGCAAVIPSVLIIPFILIDRFHIVSKVIKVSLFALPAIVVFRTVEAMHGTSPHTVESSLGTYMVYYTSMGHFEWNPKTKTRRKITSSELLSNLIRIFVHFHLLSLLLSFAMHFDFTPFPSNVELDKFHFNLDILSPGHLGNTYVLTVITYLFTALLLELASFFVDNVRGIYTKPVFHNPVFTSRSVTEFWGRKWNLATQGILKHGVFLPASQSSFSLPLTVGLTFLASGLMHEYIWTLMFYQHDPVHYENEVCLGCFHPIFFKATGFFLYNAVLMLLERATPVGLWLTERTKSWPTILVSTLGVMTVLPVSHLFTGDWVSGGYFTDLSIGLWTFRKLR